MIDTNQKLKEANYFLSKVLSPEEDPMENPEVFQYNLSAFLSAWRSVFDIMLYDYALKFFPSLTRDDYIKLDSFRLAAKAQNHEEASSFIKWYDKKFRFLKNNPLWKK